MSSTHRSVVRAAILVMITAVVLGCSAPQPAAPASLVTPVRLVTPAPPPTAAATEPVATAPTTAAAPASPEAPAETPSAAEPGTPLFGPAWGDRTVYAAGLVASEQQTLDGLPGASEYRIDLRIADSLTQVTGEQQVRYTNREDVPLDEIYLRLFPNALGGKMRVSDVTVDGAGVTPEYQYDGTAIRVPLPQPLAVGASTVLGLKYRIDVPRSLDKGYGLLSYTDDVLALDTPYAVVPVYNEEGWNVETPPGNADTSFNDVSFYQVRVTAPAELKLVTTGVETGREAAAGEQIVTFAQGPGRDFWVAGSPDYVMKTQQAGETLIKSYARPGEDDAQKVALDAAAKALEVYGRRFGPYPYTELDVAATPMLALGIEYPGAVGISARIFEPDSKPNNGSAGVIVESTVAHELAHQWFYNLVGNDQIDEPWVDEAMAQYGTGLYFTDNYGQAAGEAWRETWGSRWDRSDREEKPVGLPARDYTEREYSAIVYGRGPLFLSALAERMGQAKFDQFLKEYSTRFRWGIATADEFKTEAAAACGCDLSDLYRKWLDP